MAKGKYAAKSANRAAAVDNEVIVEMRSQIAKLKAERDALTTALHDASTEVDRRVLRAVTEATAAERAALVAKSTQDQASVAHAFASAATEVTNVLAAIYSSLRSKYGDEEACISSAVTNRIAGEGPSLLRVLDILDSDRAGEHLEYIMTSGSTAPYPAKDGRSGQGRTRRRRSAREVDRDLAFYDARRKNVVLAEKTAKALSSRDSDEQEA